MGFNLDGFVDSAVKAAKGPRAVAAINDLMKTTFGDPQVMQTAITPFDTQDELLYADDSVSVYWVRFIVNELVPPHNHKIPAFIGVYQGAEINHLYRRNDDGALELVTSKRVGPGDTLSIGPEGIHGVHAEGDCESLGLHVYLGRLETVERDLFHPATGEALPFTDENYQKLLRPVV